MSKYRSLKEEAFAANMEIPRRGLAIYSFGNVSAFDPSEAVFAIKPSGVPYENLKPDDMVVVDLQSNVVEGSLNPSSDTRTHAVLYRSLGCIRGVAHTHSAYAVAWAQAVRAIPIYGTTHADHLPGDVPCTEVMSADMASGDYEEETGKQIIKAMDGLSPSEYEMIVVACHGPFTWGKDAVKAVYNSVVLEEIARMALLTEQVKPSAVRLPEALINKHYERKHGKNAYYGQGK
ncbi:MAG: L-ribulose-5-phosphate 4-epimerase AraD [Victivallales bacterium]|nr:L-ribulose-5-phosphate 4-epimerase AraD [Victivallales bacterium]